MEFEYTKKGTFPVREEHQQRDGRGSARCVPRTVEMLVSLGHVCFFLYPSRLNCVSTI